MENGYLDRTLHFRIGSTNIKTDFSLAIMDELYR